MEITYKIDSPNNISDEEIQNFLKLLKRQDQVNNPTLEKVKSCIWICCTCVDEIFVGIGAIKKVYKKPFDYAGISELKDHFEFEIGYLYVENELNSKSYRGLGIGKNITRLLLQKMEKQNIFATTELKVDNPMLNILKSFGFVSIGNPFKGGKTNKVLSLLVLIRHQERNPK
jgi:hypothetical protein